jgi:hypothetical protein
MITFSEWVADRDGLALLRVVWEAVDPRAIAANQINNYLSEKLGTNANWHAIMMQAAQPYAAGQDVDDMVTRISTHIIQSLNTPGDKLAQAVQQVQAGEEPGKMLALITTAARLRARRFGESRAGNLKGKLDKRSVHLSRLGDVGQELPEKPVQDEEEVGRLKSLVMQELAAMRDETNYQQSKQRLELAMKVAEVRLANAPDFVGMDELLRQFPDIRHTTMHNILHDIQMALLRVSRKYGLEGLEADIRRRTG